MLQCTHGTCTIIQRYQVKFVDFRTHSSSDRLTMDVGGGDSAKVYYRKAIPADVTLSGTSPNKIIFSWNTDAYSHQIGFKLFFYCFVKKGMLKVHW